MLSLAAMGRLSFARVAQANGFLASKTMEIAIIAAF
jgi:hypothetical protein